MWQSGIGFSVDCILSNYFIIHVMMTESTMQSYLVFMQDVWTELGRPCGIHQKQVVLSFLPCPTENWHTQLLVSFCHFLHVRSLVEIDFVLYTGRSNGDSFCFRSPTKDNPLWWLLLQLLYSWHRCTIWWAGISSSGFLWALMKSMLVLRLLCLFADT